MTDNTYARIQDGVVFEFIELDSSIDISTMFHSDLTWVDVTDVSPAPQQGWSYTAPDTFAEPPPPPALTPDQVYDNAINAGCAIVSTATPEITGIYAITDAAIGKITAVVSGINAGMGLPGGGDTFYLLDIDGNPHSIGSSDFINLAVALRNYVYELVIAEATNSGPPAQPITIS